MLNTIDKLEPYTKKSKRKKFRKIFFISIFPLLVFYTIFLSPHIEPIIQESFFSVVRDLKKEKFNYLTPIYAKSEFDNRYSLSVLTGESGLSNVKSRTKYYIKDPRILAMAKFLGDYGSPMQPYAEVFVEEADRYGLDWRLVAGISGVESAFGNITPRDSHNGWGWRGINGNADGWSMFDSWEDAIIHITERMALGYGTDLTPFDIESTYCPPCGEAYGHPWANGVTRFMNELDYYLNNLSEL
jgi:hypothetical protein